MLSGPPRLAWVLRFACMLSRGNGVRDAYNCRKVYMTVSQLSTLHDSISEKHCIPAVSKQKLKWANAC